MRIAQNQPEATGIWPETSPGVSRPLPGWWNGANFLWTVATLAALLAGLYLLLARPITTQTWDAAHLTTSVDQKNDYQLYSVETDSQGQRYRWTKPNGALFLVPATTYTNRPLKITVRARGVHGLGLSGGLLAAACAHQA